MLHKDFDIIVIGGGHAGCEAANICAKRGYKTILITQNLDQIARMSCNPAIGGIAKGHIVSEVDALGGIMAKIIDKTMIQFRLLNTKKGPAVQAKRAQADKLEYSVTMRKYLESLNNLTLFQDTVVDLIVEKNRIIGVVTERGNRITAKAVVLTTGTFMEGKIHIGEFQAISGRFGEPAALGLSENLRKLGFTIGRLKTGTPARVKKRSIDFDKLEMQIGDPEMFRFSNFTFELINRPNVPCYITYTNENTHKIIRENFHRSPLFSGRIKGIGSRYCPSIEDKVKKFPEKDRHQVFVEPEGLYTDEMYLNGLSSSLPEDVQFAFLRTIRGFEHIEIVRPAYAVEYDFINPIQLKPSLETKLISGLFIAGQTNGTSGYEEAAGQGIIAGINAFLYVENEPPFILGRDEAYIGVLIDDLVTKGVDEPYRMFTSRAEYRLKLRSDNADIRLAKYAIKYGLITEDEKKFFLQRENDIEEIKKRLHQLKLTEEEIYKINIESIKKGSDWVKYLKNPEVDVIDAYHLYKESHPDIQKENFLTAAIEIKYKGYIDRHNRYIERDKKMEMREIPEDIDYDAIFGLSTEGREKLKKIKPKTLGMASRILGVSPSDISILSMHLYLINKKKDKKQNEE
ncbi:MAG TPA: tRNA uridine-5-carboxymethylaminomethyl(34) synthesis enzyme MnmG [Spirochaetota bacterium]|nr:tRNA uridine-5-carboxymethylaminomethyl(34) synthesis enzyme MnmG [Spirochaetota bacterium]HOL56869.1 tRNA uridine-5-carboxymethylaminomethyl(34) synthesis enzyme MnmG [Spirochaetota bacterium]HPP03351.1 tRNA uridine-5-carboxymethylaminomethyl(34) synthesis enzyme MnmG [Spirochaetota bacterium]